MAFPSLRGFFQPLLESLHGSRRPIRGVGERAFADGAAYVAARLSQQHRGPGLPIGYDMNEHASIMSIT